MNRVSDIYPSIKPHLPLLIVKDRTYTGVGLYVNFGYVEETNVSSLEDAVLSTDELILLPTLKNGLNYEVDISAGKINYIELVSIGESWDGILENYSWLRV